MKRVADIVVETLIENGIDVCFSVVGGGAMHLNNAFIEKKIKLKLYIIIMSRLVQWQQRDMHDYQEK